MTQNRPTECVRRALIGLGAAYALTTELVLLGLPVLPATFAWHTGLRAATVMLLLVGIGGLFTPAWRRVTSLHHGSILGASAITAAGIAALLYGLAEPVWWVDDLWYPISLIALIGTVSALITVAWPARSSAAIARRRLRRCCSR